MNLKRIEIDEYGGNRVNDFKISMHDVVIGEKDWKAFRKSCSQTDLSVIAIGAKYRGMGTKFLVKGLIVSLLIIASYVAIVVGFVMNTEDGFGLIIGGVAGWLISNFIAVKLVGYINTYNLARRKLPKELKIYVDNFFVEPMALSLINMLIRLLLWFGTLPYKFILLVISSFAPKLENWAIARGLTSVVVTIPSNYSLDQLDELDNFYRSSTFGKGFNEQVDESERKRLASYKAYEIVGENKVLYSNDGTHFYKKKGDYGDLYLVGVSSDNGKTIEFTKEYDSMLKNDLEDLK